MPADLTAPPAPPPRRRRAGLSADPNVRSVQVGVGATILFHLLIFLLGPTLLEEGLEVSFTPTSSADRTFDIELAPEMFPEREAEKPPLNFVETNPDAPENTPDNTVNFSNRNQQSAQPTPTPDPKGDRPFIEGEKDVQSTQIVDGRLNQPPPTPAPPPPQPAVQPVQPQQAATRAQEPLPGIEKFEGENAEGAGSSINPVPIQNATAVPEKVEGLPDAPIVPGATGRTAQVDPRMPQPRMQVPRPNTRPAVFQDNPVGTANVGIIGRDAKWDAFGEYLNKLSEAVQQRWENFIVESNHYPARGSTVVISFVLDSAGKIASLRVVDSATGDLATGWCTAAINPRIGFSYGPWTDSMVTMLGPQTELTFRFLYR